MDGFIAPPTGTTIEQIISLIGALVPVLSLIAGFFNGRIRNAQSAGEPINPTALKAVAALNVMAVNFDKAAQLIQLVRTGAAPTTTPRAALAGADQPKQEPTDGQAS